MRVLEMWRYPVKSLRGERLEEAEIDVEGVSGDRRYAIFDVATGFGLTARRVPALLFAAARMRPDGSAEITLPDGSIARNDAALSEWLGRGVVLRSTAQVTQRRFENPEDFENEATGRWEPFEGSNGAFQDSGNAAVSLLSRPSIRDWEQQRFRANIVLDEAGENDLVNTRIRLGAAILDVRKPLERCVMVTRPQPGGIERDLDVLRTIHRELDGCLAIGAVVAAPGTVRTGDELLPVSG
ncbi:MAG: MOSC N-terminal beta barrel domain-containing protein [Actinomycetota bacterium]|nr:MOSC N-terminal beta barrel domain-containing protein [Actinomycetota bacterium]